MSNTKTTKDGWTRDFDICGGDLRAAEAEACAYMEGLNDAAPGEFETECEEHDSGIRVAVRRKVTG